MKVAIIEDDAGFTHLVNAVLHTNLHSFKEVDEFVDTGYDLVVTDLRLKKTYGFETIVQLREKTKAPIVVLTGMAGPYLSTELKQAMQAAGAVEVYSKDVINLPGFKDILEKIADGRK